MSEAPERPPPAAAAVPCHPARRAETCHPARWAEPLPGPNLLGLVVAALVGGTAAASWSLSAWLVYHEGDLRQSRSHALAACPANSAASPADLTETAQYRAPAVPCSTASAAAVGDVPKTIERRRHGIGLYFAVY